MQPVQHPSLLIANRTPPTKDMLDIHSVMTNLHRMTDSDVILSVTQLYPEMVKLAGKVQATPEGITGSFADSPSKKLFGEQHIEFDRTAVGILAMKWVLAGDYVQFSAPHALNVKLSLESFNHLKAYLEGILKTPEDIDAMVTYMVINDLGKINAVIEEVEKLTHTVDVDHDKILLVALKSHPEISPSFCRLSARHQRLIIKGLEPKFNIGQFMQGENVPASLNGLHGFDKDSLDFYLLHAVFDIAGAAGHINPAGAVVMTEPTYQNFRKTIDAITQLTYGKSLTAVYDHYLTERGKSLGLTIDSPADRAALRISLMLRASTVQEAQEVLSVMQALPVNVRAILEKELNISGVDDGLAILLYYSPATLANARAALKKANHPEASKKGLEIGLICFARIFQEARTIIKSRRENGVFTVNVSKIAEGAKVPEALSQKNIELNSIGDDAEAVLVDNFPVDQTKFPKLSSLAELPGKRVVVIGIGGGSDVIQAAQLAKLMNHSKEIPCVISIRTSVTTSVSPTNRTAEERTIQNHGGEVIKGVYRVKPESTGSGRFLENLPAKDIPVYLVLDEQNGTLAARIEAAVKDAGGADTLVAVDTGGDALYSTSIDSAKATPDQDLRVLNTLTLFDRYNIITAEIAVGVDSPDDAQQVLTKARATYYQLTASETSSVINTYKEWKMDGTDATRFGKTPLAWQKALQDERGIQTLALPTRVVIDSSHPWNPFVLINESMKGIFFMGLGDHIRAISSSSKRIDSFSKI